jgi:hypothetical protein
MSNEENVGPEQDIDGNILLLCFMVYSLIKKKKRINFIALNEP